MIDKIVALIKETGNFIILTHLSADGDAVGSALAMSFILTKLGKRSCIVFEEEISKLYSFLPRQDVYCIKKTPFKNIFDNYTAIALDCGDISRLGRREDIFHKAGTTINIDHHHTNQGYADVNFIDASYSSTGEMVFDLAKALGTGLDKNIADCLYVAIVTDTGGFKHGNTNSRTHLIVSELLCHGVDTSYIAMQVFDKISRKKIMLIRRALDSLEFFIDSKVSVMKISNDDFSDIQATDDDTEGLVEIARNIEDVEVAVLIKEIKKGSFRVNLRSNTDFDVSKVAALFSGGGHIKAAGCNFKGDYENNLKLLIKHISERI